MLYFLKEAIASFASSWIRPWDIMFILPLAQWKHDMNILDIFQAAQKVDVLFMNSIIAIKFYYRFII